MDKRPGFDRRSNALRPAFYPASTGLSAGWPPVIPHAFLERFPELDYPRAGSGRRECPAGQIADSVTLGEPMSRMHEWVRAQRIRDHRACHAVRSTGGRHRHALRCPGAPWENGYATSFHAKLRDELLTAALSTDLSEAKTLAAPWQDECNHRRSHSALGYQTPAAHAATCGPAAADAALRAPPRTPPGALLLNPSFFLSAESGTPKMATEDLTLTMAGT